MHKFIRFFRTLVLLFRFYNPDGYHHAFSESRDGIIKSKYSRKGIFVCIFSGLIGSNNSMHCEKCGAYIPLGGIFCLECGFRRETLRRCSQCGNPLEEGMEYCISCGAPVMEFSGERVCPRCGGMVLKNARFCIICGLKVKGIFPLETKARKCPHCGRMNEDAENFCIYCGEKF